MWDFPEEKNVHFPAVERQNYQQSWTSHLRRHKLIGWRFHKHLTSSCRTSSQTPLTCAIMSLKQIFYTSNKT